MNTHESQVVQNTNNRVSKIDKLAYRDGYLQGREQEHQIQERLRVNRSIRDNDNAAKGLLLGITITSLAGLLGSTIFFLMHQNQSPTSPVETFPIHTNSQS